MTEVERYVNSVLENLGLSHQPCAHLYAAMQSERECTTEKEEEDT